VTQFKKIRVEQIFPNPDILRSLIALPVPKKAIGIWQGLLTAGWKFKPPSPWKERASENFSRAGTKMCSITPSKFNLANRF